MRGFTLIEVIVVVFLVTLLTAISVANFSGLKQKYALSRSAYKLAQDVRRVQDMGMSGAQTKDAFGNLVPIKGYGFYVDAEENSSEYTIYGDLNANQIYDTDDYVVERVQVEEGVKITGVLNTGYNRADVNFRPPNPDILITPILRGYSWIGIVLELETGGDGRIISINRSGLVEIK